MERRVTGLHCLVAIAFWYWLPGGAYVESWLAGHSWYARSLAYHYYSDALLLAFLAGAVAIGRPALREVLGRAPASRDVVPVALTVLTTFCASGAFTTLTMVPLSYLVPSFVTWWLDWSYPVSLYLAADGSIPVAANALHLVSLVVVTPILEELIFRGYLLNAWVRKWGLWTGVLLSSAVFGALHSDPVPAMLTGVGFALLYLRTRSLWAPIVAHAVYNCAATAWNVWEIARNGWEYYVPTLEGLRSEWWLGVVELLIVAVLMDQVMRRGALGPLRLPVSRADP